MKLAGISKFKEQQAPFVRVQTDRSSTGNSAERRGRGGIIPGWLSWCLFMCEELSRNCKHSAWNVHRVIFETYHGSILFLSFLYQLPNLENSHISSEQTASNRNQLKKKHKWIKTSLKFEWKIRIHWVGFSTLRRLLFDLHLDVIFYHLAVDWLTWSWLWSRTSSRSLQCT